MARSGYLWFTKKENNSIIQFKHKLIRHIFIYLFKVRLFNETI